MKYLLGLDNGGTTTKAALFTLDGAEIAVFSTETEAFTPRPGYVECDMETKWQANCAVIRNVIKKASVDAKDIVAVACCGHGKGLYLWGKDGKPVRPGILSTDNRAWEYPVRWAKDGTEQQAFALSCQHVLACQPVALLSWLRDNEPGTLENIEWILECKDYIRFRLTGEAKAELTDYSGTNLLNLHTRRYDDRLLALFGLKAVKGALPPLCRTTDVVGCVSEEAAAQTGLCKGTPVAGGMFDIDACAIAVNVTDERYICMIAGTWSINEFICKAPVTDGSVMMNSLFALPQYYLVEECSPTSAGNNEWFINTLLPELKKQSAQNGRNVYDELNEWVASVSENEFCPAFLPFVMASNVHPNAKGSFVGLSSYHTRKHMLRSVYEGIAFSHKYHLEKLLASRSQPPEGIRLAGGVAKSSVWTQMFADIMELPIETYDANEAGALGCVIAASVAVGEYPSIEAATAAMCRKSGTYLPDPAKSAVYRKKYAMYRKVIDALDCVWDDMQEMM